MKNRIVKLKERILKIFLYIVRPRTALIIMTFNYKKEQQIANMNFILGQKLLVIDSIIHSMEQNEHFRESIQSAFLLFAAKESKRNAEFAGRKIARA